MALDNTKTIIHLHGVRLIFKLVLLLLVKGDRSCLGRGFAALGGREPPFCRVHRGAISAIASTKFNQTSAKIKFKFEPLAIASSHYQ